MGEPLDMAAVTGAWEAMLRAPQRPSPGAWWAEREPALRRLSEEAWLLEVNADHRRGLLRGEAAELVDGLLARVARGRGALDVAIGEGLEALSVGDRSLRRGYCCVGDFAREKLGIAARTAQAMAQLARELRQLPLLREAVRRGEVSASKARALVRVAFGENEAWWVERARSETVRGLAAAVRGEREDEAEEAWERICVPLPEGSWPEIDEALVLAGKVAGTMPPRHQCLEALAQEYLGESPEEGDGAASNGDGPMEEAWRTDRAGDLSCSAAGAGAAARAGAASPSGFRPHPDRGFPSWPVEGWLEAAKESLEEETGRWEALLALDPVVAPRAGEEASPLALVEELQRLAGMRRRWDELLGHLGLVMRFFGLWRELGFATFDHYCEERLWMAPRAVEQRVWLERKLYHLPGLREALRSGRLSYEQARLLAGEAGPESLEEWIRRAEGMTVIALRRFIDKGHERQMSARGELAMRVPVRVAELLAAAIRARQGKAEHALSPGECLLDLARHFRKTWHGAVKERSTPGRRARKRDEWCQVPGCSRRAGQGHHVIHVSQGGSDDPGNVAGICAAHHLHGVHRGWIRVSGRAPDHLVWELGERG